MECPASQAEIIKFSVVTLAVLTAWCVLMVTTYLWAKEKDQNTPSAAQYGDLTALQQHGGASVPTPNKRRSTTGE